MNISINRGGQSDNQIFGVSDERAIELSQLKNPQETPQEGDSTFGKFVEELTRNAQNPEEFAYLVFRAGKVKATAEMFEEMLRRK